MRAIAIAGVGLIGGSFGLAMREAGFTGEIIGVSSPAALEEGLRIGAITRGASLAEAAQAADLIYLAQPVDRILTTIEELEPLVREGTLVTDAGSTKEAIVARANQWLRTSYFVGGHPMAGKEQRGAAAAQADLFRGRPYILTTGAEARDPGEAQATAEFRQWLEKIGAVVIEMDAREHDETVAFTSHLPQVLSTALALTLAREGKERTLQIFGPGLLDMTRLAMSASELWRPILQTNRAAVQEALQSYQSVLQDLQHALESDTVWESFSIGSDWAAKLRRSKAGTRQ